MMVVSISASGKTNSNMDEALKLGLMGVSIPETFKMEKWMDLASTPGLMASITKAKCPRVIFMARVQDYTVMERFTKEVGKMTSCMGWVGRLIPMAKVSMANSSGVSKKGLGLLLGQMVNNMSGNGQRENFMATEEKLFLMVESM